VLPGGLNAPPNVAGNRKETDAQIHHRADFARSVIGSTTGDLADQTFDLAQRRADAANFRLVLAQLVAELRGRGLRLGQLTGDPLELGLGAPMASAPAWRSSLASCRISAA
jgi:hypothetical protein